MVSFQARRVHTAVIENDTVSIVVFHCLLAALVSPSLSPPSCFHFQFP